MGYSENRHTNEAVASVSTTASPSPESVRPGIAPRCGTCWYFGEQSICQRFPPVVVSSGLSGWVQTYFPVVARESWCGEFKPILAEREQGGQAEKPNEAKI